MKKYVVWILMIAMTLTLCACRLEAQTGGAGSPTESVGETEENVGQGAEVDENAEDTLIPEESEEGTEITENAPAENYEKAEVTLPATTTEDPALRAEADRIRKEQGENEYRVFCMENDIKCYINYAVEEDFTSDQVCVRLKRSASVFGAPIPDFSCINYERIEETNYYGTEKNPDFSRSFTIYLKTKSKEEVLLAIHALNKLDYVQSATPNHKLYSH